MSSLSVIVLVPGPYRAGSTETCSMSYLDAVPSVSPSENCVAEPEVL